MRTFFKKTLALIIAVIISLSVIPLTSYAVSELGMTKQNPIVLGKTAKCKLKWNKNNYDQEYYISFKMKKKGYAAIFVSKPKNPWFEIKELYLLNENGKEIWNCRTSGQNSDSLKKYKYVVGLNKGNFYF